MKFIGQHIFDFIARFRNDVYLENISTGTIASGGNLGLDSNNKIVKAAEVGGSVDLTSEVTGVLPVANGGTGASTLADNSILTGTGTSAITAESTLTYNSVISLLTLSSTASSLPQFVLSNSNTDAAGSKFKFQKTAVGADDDIIGVIDWTADDDGGTAITYATIQAEIADASNDDEAGRLELKVTTNSNEHRQALTATGLGTGSRVDIGLGHGTDSTTTIAGTLTMGSTAFVDNSGVIQVATQGTIDHNSLANYEASEHIRWHNDVSASATIHTNNITDLHGAGVDGSANQLLTDDGDGTVTSEADLTFDSNILTVSSSSSGSPNLVLKNTNTDDVPTTLNFWKTEVGTSNDKIGKIVFQGEDAGGGQHHYAYIQGSMADATAGAEAGKIELAVAEFDGGGGGVGTPTVGLTLDGNTDADGEIDVTIGAGTASTATIAGKLESTNSVTIKGNNFLFFNDSDNSHSTRIAHSTVATNRTITLPDNTGTVALQETLGWNGSQTRIKILHSDFIADDGGRPVMINDAGVGAEKLYLKTHSTLTAYVTIAIPTGFDATHVMIYGFGTPAVEVWEHQITDKVGVSKGTGNVGTEIDITDVTSSATNYLFIQVAQGASDEIYGGYVTIAAT